MLLAVRFLRLFRPGDRVLVGVSGGPDSLALLLVLHELAPRLEIELHAAHLNHRLRPEAGEEAEFVRRLASSLGIPCTVEEEEVRELARSRRLGLEEAGREARYAFFQRLRKATGASLLALAHTREDQAVTVLHRLIRGSGPRGLRGMLPCREGWVVRPLLYTGRAQVEAYLAEKGISPLRDPSNLDFTFFRNRLRWELLPLLERYHPGVTERLAQTAEVLRAEEEWLEALTEELFSSRALLFPGTVVLPRSALLSLPLAAQRRLLRRAYAHLEFGELSFERVEEALEVAGGGKKRAASLPRRITARREGDFLVLEGRERLPPFSFFLSPGEEREVPGALVSVRAFWGEGEEGDGRLRAVFDPLRLRLPLLVRSWQPGDRFQPPGAEEPVKLKEFFSRLGVPRFFRSRVPLVFSGDTMIWVAGYGQDFRFAPPPGEGKQVLCLELGFLSPAPRRVIQ